MEAKSWEFNSLGEDSSLLRRVHMEDLINAKQKMAILTTLMISNINLPDLCLQTSILTFA